MLRSIHHYVAIRPHGRRWVAALGIGGHTEPMRGSWATPERAEAAGRAAWRERLDRDLEAIRAEYPDEPIRAPEAPIVLRCRCGQSGYSALTERDLTALLGPPTGDGIRQDPDYDPIPPEELAPGVEFGARLSRTRTNPVRVLVWRHGDRELTLCGSDLRYLRRAGTDEPGRLMTGSAAEMARELLRGDPL